MDDLIRALTILRDYGNPACPTHCEHDVLYVMVDPALVAEQDLDVLKGLGFHPDTNLGNCFYSFRFGSA